MKSQLIASSALLCLMAASFAGGNEDGMDSICHSQCADQQEVRVEERTRADLLKLGNRIVRAVMGHDDVLKKDSAGSIANKWRKEMQKEILDLASANVDWGSRTATAPGLGRDLKFYTDVLFESWHGNEAAKSEFVHEMSRSNNLVLREYAAAKERLSELFKEPMQLRFTALDGREVDLERLRGKVVLIEYWATSCGGCISQLPKLQELYAQYHAEGFEVIGFSCDKVPKKVLDFVSRKNIPWPQYMDEEAVRKDKEKYGFVWVSNILLLDKQGRLLMHAASPSKERLEAAIRQQLGLPPLLKSASAGD